MTKTPCTCEAAGYCPALGRHMSPGRWRECHTDSALCDLFHREAAAGKYAAAAYQSAYDPAASFTPSPPHPLTPSLPCRGPGTEMLALTAGLKIDSGPTCTCKALAREMDAWGAAGCRQRREEIAAKMRENARTVSWFQKTRAALLAVANGLAFAIDPRDVFGSLVDEAIRRAEQKETEATKEEGRQAIRNPSPSLPSFASVRTPGVRHLLYHCYPVRGNGVWQANMNELRERIALFDGRRIVSVAYDDRTDDPDDVAAAFRQLGGEWEFLYHPNVPDRGEVITWPEKLAKLKGVPGEDLVCYLHAKAVTHGLETGAWEWARGMYRLCLDGFERVQARLRHWPLCGPIVKRGKVPGGWLYAGTFFWFRAGAVFGKVRWWEVEQHYAGVECWPSRHFPAKQASCLSLKGGDELARQLSSREYWRRELWPRLERVLAGPERRAKS